MSPSMSESESSRCRKKMMIILTDFDIPEGSDVVKEFRHNTLGGRAIDATRQDLEFGNGEYDANYKRPVFVKVSKATATDSSFRLFGDELKKRQRIYNAVLFVVSHRAIFKYRARKTIKAAYEQRFYVSEKQKANLKG
ncbi:hypothetical protein HO173_013411 [Letharia columbiana]|uniref:Uncharacterized protein n=1 Tax=Letharia columbiana TaxID=112416 RepID=A0A8H6CFL8_9LECA|nr:uncharacterized protein HO173_013411 [Letharia columbiana]KAF6222503.1 hypothetical protein HO173_013411 [Letharia columbiana]